MIAPANIATRGYLSGQALCLATRGYICLAGGIAARVTAIVGLEPSGVGVSLRPHRSIINISGGGRESGIVRGKHIVRLIK